MNIKLFYFLGIFLIPFLSCKKEIEKSGPTIDYYTTSADQASLLKKGTQELKFDSPKNNFSFLDIDTSVAYQSIEGFGYTLTGGSADLISKLPAVTKQELLNEIFGSGGAAMNIQYLRISLGASDLSASVFSYDDLPTGQVDPQLAYFSLAKDTINLIPLLKEIIQIRPQIKIMASPWSPPVWMKSNKNSVGGSLLSEYYQTYADYIVKYIKAMKSHGIIIDALTIQNEPQHGGNNPSMLMTATEQANFIKNNLGPSFKSAGITTKIIIWDHNCDHPEYPISILNDPAAKPFVSGTAFHLYNGEVTALQTVHNAHPDKDLYFTEQWTGSKSDFAGDFIWHIKNVIIGSIRNWSRVALEWNLANDPSFNLHTPGGCTECKGAFTIDRDAVIRNVAYYIIAQASKFIDDGAQRIKTVSINGLTEVAFLQKNGQRVLIVLNENTTPVSFNIREKSTWASVTIQPKAAVTYIWNGTF